MENFDERLRRLEEVFGINTQSGEGRQRIEEKWALIFYETGIRRSGGSWELAGKLITQYGSLQSALEAYKDVDELKVLNCLTQKQKAEVESIRSKIHSL